MAMKGLVVAGISVAALALAGPASAAGMYWPSTAGPAALWSWTGFYAGLNAGAGWTFDSGQPRCFDASGIENGPGCQNVIGNTANGSGFIGGGQIGYNWQVNPTWVAGLETDFQGSTSVDPRLSVDLFDSSAAEWPRPRRRSRPTKNSIGSERYAVASGSR
jgi:outer membrane immunogenic protein